MRFLIGVAAALIVAGPAAAQDKSPFEQDLEKAIDRLYSDRFTESDMGRLELVEMGRKANARLIEELNKVGDPKDAKKRGPSAKVKRNLCEILGQSRDNSQNVIDALVARLSDKDEFGHTVAAAAAGALASIADEKPIPGLKDATGFVALLLIDHHPHANWAHPCTYVLVWRDGRTRQAEHDWPPSPSLRMLPLPRPFDPL